MAIPQALQDRIRTAPGDAVAHAALGDWYAGRNQWVKAAAQYRTALTLGAEDEVLRDAITNATVLEGRARPADTLSHNMFFRVEWLGRRLQDSFPSGLFSVLDAGGGDGRLAMHLPLADYVLAEPTTNGLFVDELLDFGRTFDAIVCCHVVEHIPPEGRDAFLDVLCSMANEKVMLLNPVDDGITDYTGWQQLIYDVTGANWAKEHLECDLPTLDDLVSYCERRGYGYTVTPNGSKPLALAVVFFDFYARHGRPADVARINQMFNAIAHESLDTPAWPNAWLVEIDTSSV